ncbi:MAG TPA: cell division protein FtsK, partial [Streptomyces sp.]|nr:cell division protein FtsK [Streptomyces sp.]
EEYGNITGHAVGEGPDDRGPEFDILADVLAVLAPGEDAVWNERIAARLAELRPEVYDGWTGAQITAALKPHGVTTAQVWGTDDDGEGKNRRGIKRADIAAALTRRDGKRAGS